jgi:hypothetical protein
VSKNKRPHDKRSGSGDIGLSGRKWKRCQREHDKQHRLNINELLNAIGQEKVDCVTSPRLFKTVAQRLVFHILKRMEVHLTAETEKKLKDLASQSGRGTDDLVEDAMAGYFDEVLQIRETLDSRYDAMKSGMVKPIDGEEAFASLKAKTEAERNR